MSRSGETSEHDKKPLPKPISTQLTTTGTVSLDVKWLHFNAIESNRTGHVVISKTDVICEEWRGRRGEEVGERRGGQER